MTLLHDQTIAVLGGTGPQGRGLARRFAAAGLAVVIGSRSAERAESTAAELAEATGGPVTGAGNAEAADRSDIVVVAVPWDGHKELLVELAPVLVGKIVVDCVNPMGFDKQGAYALEVPEGSAAQQAEAVLPDSLEATDVVRKLVGTIPGMRGIYAGRLRNAHQVETLTCNLISINRRYKAHSGLRITDV
jgi:predicted dinucleotide-binding enzyme